MDRTGPWVCRISYVACKVWATAEKLTDWRPYKWAKRVGRGRVDNEEEDKLYDSQSSIIIPTRLWEEKKKKTHKSI